MSWIYVSVNEPVTGTLSKLNIYLYRRSVDFLVVEVDSVTKQAAKQAKLLILSRLI
ncbi:hypothetical protein T06_14121 [Trichinella sp. T6]|nr:hypothetical protein T06_14121 [Trichinella sp. T6]